MVGDPSSPGSQCPAGSVHDRQKRQQIVSIERSAGRAALAAECGSEAQPGGAPGGMAVLLRGDGLRKDLVGWIGQEGAALKPGDGRRREKTGWVIVRGRGGPPDVREEVGDTKPKLKQTGSGA